LLTSFTVYGVNIDVAVPKLKSNAGLSVVPLDLFGSGSLKDTPPLPHTGMQNAITFRIT
jgi:hypothetical protein